MIRRLALLAILFAPAAVSQAQEDGSGVSRPTPAGGGHEPLDSDQPVAGLLKDFNPGMFAFAKPGATTPASARKVLGEPYLGYQTWVKKDQIDFYVGAPTPDRVMRVHQEAEKEKKPVEEVFVLEWRNDDLFTQSARLVFRKDLLWYSLIPVSASETSLQKIKDRYGRAPLVSSRTAIEADIVHDAKVYAYPDLGVAYLDEGGIQYKAVFAPQSPKR